MARQQAAIEADFALRVMDGLPAMMAYWDSNLRCRFANQAYKDWFGRSSSAMIGIGLKDLLGDDLFLANEQYILEALKGHRQEFRRTLVTARGDSRQTLAMYVPDHDEEWHVLGFSVLVVDVTAVAEGLAEVPYTPAIVAE